MRYDHFEDMLRHWAETTPDAPALRYGARTVSFSQLFETVQQRAALLRKSHKTCLGLLSDGSLDCVTELFAANIAGMQIVMLDENAPSVLLRQLIQYTDVDLLWGDEDLVEELSPALTQGVKDGSGKILFFTSGTTERAKAVVLTDHSLCQSAYNGSAKLPLAPEDTLLCLLPLGHVFGFVCGLLWGLSCGACVALGRGARHYIDDCAYYKPTTISVVPLLLGFLMKQRLLNQELKLILVGAGDCPPALLDAAAAMGIRVSFGYGLTETSSGVALSLGDDPYAMTVCPDDRLCIAEDGEIRIDAPTCVMKGYYRDPDATAAAFTADGWLCTGDLGSLDEAGRLHVTGRKKEILVFSDGTKLFLPEAEAQLAGLLPGEDLALCQKDGKVVLVLGGSQKTDEEIKTAVAPWQKDRPRSQQIAAIEHTEGALTRTATGKVKRWEL